MPIRTRVQQRRFPTLPAEVFISLLVAADYFVQQADALFARYGITSDQYNVLRILRGARPDGRSRSDLEARLMRRAPDVTRMLDRLERRGLVARTRDPGDRRLSMARISKAGIALLDRIAPELDALQRKLTSPLTEPQLRRLARMCDALVP
jgi:DNA-binding MarR family transcriptional regulator